MLRPTFMGFETATRGMTANQKALDIVGNNLTNLGVTGYTRQRVDLVSMSMNTRSSRYAVNTATFAGQGAAVYGVSQIRDKFLDKRFREEYADVGYYNTTSAVLGDLQNALDEISPSPMTDAMNGFMDTWNAIIQQTSTESVASSNLLSSASQIVSVFRQMSQKVDAIWDQYEYNLRLDVDNVNSILQRVAQLNEDIEAAKFNTLDGKSENYKPLELIDQRNVLLDELSGYGNITYTEDANGVVSVKMGDMLVVNGKEYETLHVQTHDNGNGYQSVSVFFNSTGEHINLATGSLRGSIDMLNGRGIHAGLGVNENFTNGILYYKEKVDAFAATFVNAFNNVIEEADSNGDPYVPPRYKSLFQFENDSLLSAGGIKVSDQWQADSSYVIKNVLDKVSTDGGNNDSSYAAKAFNLFKQEMDFGEFQGTIGNYIIFYSNTKLNSEMAFSETRLDSAVSVSENVLDQIQAVSGVSMDEEGVDMMMYQKAYQAVSRLFTTLDEILDKLINGTGVVGR